MITLIGDMSGLKSWHTIVISVLMNQLNKHVITSLWKFKYARSLMHQTKLHAIDVPKINMCIHLGALVYMKGHL